MSYIEIEVTGKAFAEGLQAAWGNDRDGRLQATKYAEDVVAFVSDLLDEIDDYQLDGMLRQMLADREA